MLNRILGKVKVIQEQIEGSVFKDKYPELSANLRQIPGLIKNLKLPDIIGLLDSITQELLSEPNLKFLEKQALDLVILRDKLGREVVREIMRSHLSKVIEVMYKSIDVNRKVVTARASARKHQFANSAIDPLYHSILKNIDSIDALLHRGITAKNESRFDFEFEKLTDSIKAWTSLDGILRNGYKKVRALKLLRTTLIGHWNELVDHLGKRQDEIEITVAVGQ